MTFAINHDDGQSNWGIDDADVVSGRRVADLEDADLPLSRQSRHQGGERAVCAGRAAAARAASGKAPADRRADQRPRTADPAAPQPAQHARSQRETDYTDLEAVRAEVREARRVFAEHHWPVIDVTRRSIEETAAAI